MMNLELKEKKQLNPYYALPVGGGYDWPYYRLTGVVDDMPAVVEIKDTTCNYYSRYEVLATIGDRMYKYFCDNVANQEKQGTTFPEAIAKEIRDDVKSLGYMVHSKEEFKEKNEKNAATLYLISETEQNPHYDPAKSYNGGGYHQPFIEYAGEVVGEHVTILIDDTSCGDFGSRYAVTIAFDEKSYHYVIDTINKEPNEYSDVPDKVIAELRPWFNEIGYGILSEKELEDRESEECAEDKDEYDEEYEEDNTYRVVSEIRINRALGTFHGVAGISTGYLDDGTHKTDFIQVFGSLVDNYIHVNRGCNHTMVYISRGHIMSILYTLGYGKAETITIETGELEQIYDAISHASVYYSA